MADQPPFTSPGGTTVGLILFITGLLLCAAGVFSLLAAAGIKTPLDEAEYRQGRSRRQAESARTGGRLLGALLILAGLATIAADSFTTVGARSVSVQTAFGKIQGDVLGPGFHWVAPWNNVEEFDASVQTLKFYKDEPEDDGACIPVRLANNTLACVDVTAQWNINHVGDIKALYLSYKTFDNIHDNLVKRQLGSALNEVFGTYDPLAAVKSDTAAAVNTRSLQDGVRAALQRDLKGLIEIPSVTIPVVHFDTETESRLKSYQQAIADTRIAEQNVATANQQALAAGKLAAQQGLKDPGVQYQNCLNLTADLAQRDQLKNLPLTWNCNSSSSGTPSLVLPAKPTR